MIKITDILVALSKGRPIFHSEADFQHALAWKIHEEYPELRIRLEKRVILSGKDAHIDIMIDEDGDTIPVEIKYKTKKLSINVCNEEFNLRNHSAQDCNRYDFVKDISRIEECLTKSSEYGYAIFLTNDPGYWNCSRKEYPKDRDFRINKGRTLQGTLSWKSDTSKGTKRGREASIKLKGKYDLKWEDYSNLGELKENSDKSKNSLFRYLLSKIT